MTRETLDTIAVGAVVDFDFPQGVTRWRKLTADVWQHMRRQSVMTRDGAVVGDDIGPKVYADDLWTSLCEHHVTSATLVGAAP